MNDRIYRSRDDRIIAGVAGGLAAQFRVDPSLVRIVWAILVIPTGGLALLLYVVMAFVVPEEPAGDARWAAWDRGPGASAWPQGDPGTPMSPPGTTTPAWGAGLDPTAAAAGAADGGAGAPAGTPSGTFPAASPNPSIADGRDAWRDQGRAWRDQRRDLRHERRNGLGPLLFGLILILVGSYFLVRTYLPAIDPDRAWPILFVLVGGVLLFGAVRRSPGPPA